MGRPNYSGKSVYISQIALIVILAQLGAGVPARNAKLPLLYEINAKMGTYESVSLKQSSFFIDAANIATMLRANSQRCLNLIDEFGKGTAERTGMALLNASIHELWRTGLEKQNLTFCTTHFLDIVRERFLPIKDIRMNVFSMEVIEQDFEGKIYTATEPQGTGASNINQLQTSSGAAVRTYRVLRGSIASESRALQCALEAGVPKRILRRAAHIAAAAHNASRMANGVVHEKANSLVAIIQHEVAEFAMNMMTIAGGRKERPNNTGDEGERLEGGLKNI